MAQAASKSCEICVATLGEFFCQQCNQMFCESCKNSHLRSKSCRNHVFQQGSNINTEVKFHCEQHVESFIFYCLPCETPVCKVCTVEIHNGHKMCQLEKYTEVLTKEVEDKIKIFMKSHESNLSILKENTTYYQEEVQSTVRAITVEGNRLKQLIDRKVGELIQSLKEDETMQLKTLSKIQKELQITLENVKGYNQQLETLKQGPADGALNAKVNQLKSEVELIKKPVLPTMPTVRYTKKSATHADINQLFGTLSTTDIRCLRDGSRLQDKLVLSPPVLLRVKYDQIKSTLEILCGTITVITKKAKKSKRKNGISHLDFRDEFNKLQEDVENVKQCFHCDDDNLELACEIYGFNRHKSDLQKEIEAREDAQTRLSEMMGKQLKTNNPAITDLSDPGRPLSLVEKLSNIYDNEWTAALEDVENITRDEALASKILLSVITDSYQECFSLRYKGTAYIGFENDRRTYSIKHKIRDISDEFGRQLKKLDGKELDKLRQAVLRKQETQVKREISACLSNQKQYILKCVELCWMMVCHSPPVHLEWNYEGQCFDHHLLKPFTEDGTVIQFMVWPVMFLFKDGPLLCKGVAQGCSGKKQTQF